MRQNDLIEEACKQVPPSEVDAFVKGARWILDSINDDNVRVVLEDQLPYGSIVLERFPNGSPKVVLGPSLGTLNQVEAEKMSDNRLWRLPTEKQLKILFNKNKSVFANLYKNGEKSLMTRSLGTNQGWTNPVVLDCKDGSTAQIVPNYSHYPTRALLDLSQNYK